MFKNVRPWLRFIEGATGGAGPAGGSASGDAGGDAASSGGQGDKGGDGDGDGSSDEEDDPEPKPESKQESASDSSSEPPAPSGQADEKEDTEEIISAVSFKQLQAEVAALKEQNAKQEAEKLAAEAKDVAKSHGLPEGMADRLKGKTREELEADAKSLAQVLGARATDPTQGQGGTGGARRSLGDVIAARIAAAGLN